MGGGWSTPRPDRFTPGKDTRYPVHMRPGGRDVQSGRVRKISPVSGFDPQTVHPVASRYTDCAIQGLIKDWTFSNLRKYSKCQSWFGYLHKCRYDCTDESGIYEAVIKLVYAWFKILTVALLKIQASGCYHLVDS